MSQVKTKHLPKLLCALTFLSVSGNAALADDLALTIYGNNIALVEDSRDIRFANGEQTIVLPGVSSQIRSETATFIASDIDILEQNFDFDLLSPEKLMEKAVGEFVEIVRVNPGTGRETRERAKVLSVNNGVVIQIGQKIEVLRDDNLPTRVIFDKVPPNLKANPTLSVDVTTDRPGTREASLTYLTGGLNWRADYVAVFDEAAKEMDLQGWATLTNNTKTTFNEADVSLIAGTVQTVGGNRNQYNPRFNPRNPRQSGFNNAGTEASPQERIGDNYLYPLLGKITVKSAQTKQVGIVDAKNVRAEKIYDYRAYNYSSQNDPQSVDVRVSFSNSREGGLGTALPQGTFRVYSKDAQGRAQFIGEDNIGHIPGGSEMALKIGEAFDIQAQGTVTSDTRISRNVRDVSMSYRFTNATTAPVTVRFRQSFPSWGWRNTEVLNESQEGRESNAHTRIWDVEIPAEGETTLTYKVRERSRW